MAKIKMNAANLGAVINRNIYGHFSEHLGRCIYGGLYVGEDSPIPNKKGMRTDVVEALKKLNALVCMECGCCAYVCPAKRPLVQTNRLAKAVLREHLAKEQKIREEAKALAGKDKK